MRVGSRNKLERNSQLTGFSVTHPPPRAVYPTIGDPRGRVTRESGRALLGVSISTLRLSGCRCPKEVLSLHRGSGVADPQDSGVADPHRFYRFFFNGASLNSLNRPPTACWSKPRKDLDERKHTQEINVSRPWLSAACEQPRGLDSDYPALLRRGASC